MNPFTLYVQKYLSEYSFLNANNIYRNPKEFDDTITSNEMDKLPQKN